MSDLTVTDGVFAAQLQIAVAGRVLSETDPAQSVPYLGSQTVATAVADNVRIRSARSEALQASIGALDANLRAGIEDLLGVDHTLASGLEQR